MAQQGLVSDIVAKEAEEQVVRIRTELKGILSEINGINRNASKVELKLSDGGSIVATNAALKELTQSTIQLERLQQQQAKTAQQLAKAEQEREKILLQQAKAAQAANAAEVSAERQRTQAIKTQQEELRLKKQIQAEQDKIAKQKAREEKQTADLTNDYALLSKAYQEAALRAKNYALQLGAGHQLTIQAVNDANKLGDTLKALDGVVGQYQRNVGNYNMVGAQFNQILRELPNLAQSPAIFIQSLSNNLSYFVESIVHAKREGQGLGQIFTGLFKGGNALILVINLAVTAFSFLANVLRDNAKEAKEAEKEYSNLGDAISNAITKQNQLRSRRGESMGGGLAAAERELALLEAQGVTGTRLAQAQKKVSDARVLQLENEKSAYQALNEEIGRAVQYYVDQGLNSEAVKDKLAADKEIIKSIKDVTGVTQVEAEKQAAAIAEVYGTGDDPRSDFRARIRDINVQILDEQGRFNADRVKADRDAADKLKKEREKADKEWHELQERNYKAQYETQKQALEAEAEQLKSIADDENANVDTRLNAYAEYYALKVKLINAAADYERNIGKKTAIEVEQIERQKGVQLQQLADEALNFDIEIIEKEEEARRKAAEANRKASIENYKVNQDSADRAKKAWETFYNYLRDQAAAVLKNVIAALGQASSKRAENDINNIQRQIDANERAKQVEIDRIKVSQRTAEEKEAAIQEAEARTEAKRAALEAQQRNRRRQAALSERNASIAQMIVDTSLAVIRALSDKTVPYPVRVGYAATAAALGSAQIAIARSAPLPEYKDGTMNHKGGFAVVGDGGEREMVITKDGRIAMTPDKPTVIDLPKGAKVLNQDMIAQMLQGIEQGSMRRLVGGDAKERHDRRLANTIERALEKQADRMENALKKNRSIFKTNINIPDSYYNRKVKGK